MHIYEGVILIDVLDCFNYYKIKNMNSNFVFHFISVNFVIFICDNTYAPVLAHLDNYNMFLDKPYYSQYDLKGF